MTYNKLRIFKVINLKSFDICRYSWNSCHSKDSDIVSAIGVFTLLCKPILPWLLRYPLISFLPLQIGLYFLQFYIHGTVQYSVVSYFEIHSICWINQFLFPPEYHDVVGMCHNLLIHWSVEHLDCLQCLAFIKNAAANILLQSLCVDTCFHLLYIIIWE